MIVKELNGKVTGRWPGSLVAQAVAMHTVYKYLRELRED